jgi:hypothetical protein
VLGFEPSEYAEEKYSQFQKLISNLNSFDLESISKLVQEGVGTGNKKKATALFSYSIWSI